MKDKPHSDSSSRHFSKIQTNYKSGKEMDYYKGKIDVSSHSSPAGTITWKSAYTSDEKDHRVCFQLNIDKIKKHEINFKLNRKDYKKNNTPDSSL